MLTHCLIPSSDVERSRKFYDATMAVLGHTDEFGPTGERLRYSGPRGAVLVGKPRNGGEPSGNGWVVGFEALDDAMVDKWFETGLANGGTDAGAPGPRANANNSYGAYLFDPDGNKVSAYHMTR